MNDWDWVVSQPWCSGAGTSDVPYRIENVIINGLNNSSCISIINSVAYFVIENCTLYNSIGLTGDAGIVLTNVDNGYIYRNNISENNGYGIYISDSESNIVEENNITNNKASGIFNIVSNYTTIFNNTIIDNYFGIFNFLSDNTDVISNTVIDNR